MLRDSCKNTVGAVALSLGLTLSGCGINSGQREDGQAIVTPTVRTYEEYLASRRWIGSIPTQVVGDQDVFSAIEIGSAPAKQVVDMSVNEEISEDKGTVRLRVRSGENEYLLGEEGGAVKPGAKGARSFAWFNYCQRCIDLDQGLYVLDLETGAQTRIASRALDILGSVLIAEPWVVYYASGGDYSRSLQAHNLETGEDITLDTEPPYGPTGPGGDIVLNEGALAWEGENPNGQGIALLWADLDTQEKRVIVVEPHWGNAGALAVSKSLLLWRERYWRVCDIRTGRIFPLPLLPAGSEDLINESVTYPVVSGNRVYWSVEAYDFREDFTLQVGQ